MSTSCSEDTVTQWFIDNGFGEHSKNFLGNSFFKPRRLMYHFELVTIANIAIWELNNNVKSTLMECL